MYSKIDFLYFFAGKLISPPLLVLVLRESSAQPGGCALVCLNSKLYLSLCTHVKLLDKI